MGTSTKKRIKKQIVKETRDMKIILGKSGTGHRNASTFIPITWLDHMGITEDDRITEMTYSPRTKKITIRKKDSEVLEDDE